MLASSELAECELYVSWAGVTLPKLAECELYVSWAGVTLPKLTTTKIIHFSGSWVTPGKKLVGFNIFGYQCRNIKACSMMISIYGFPWTVSQSSVLRNR
jgi:hypothetical protein